MKVIGGLILTAIVTAITIGIAVGCVYIGAWAGHLLFHVALSGWDSYK